MQIKACYFVTGFLLLCSPGVLGASKEGTKIPPKPVFSSSIERKIYPKFNIKTNKASAKYSEKSNLDLGIIGTPFIKSFDTYHLSNYWLDGFSFPLFKSKNESDFLAWVVGGQFVQKSNVQEFIATGLTQMGDEEAFTFLVYKHDENTGWLQIQFRLGDQPNVLISAWTKESYLEKSETPLRFVSWADVLKGQTDLYLTHNLVDGAPVFLEPNTESKRLGTFQYISDTYKGPKHTINSLDYKGDWMKVKYYPQECSLCIAVPCDEKQAKTGWVKWRDEQHGLLFWFPTRGC